MKKVTKYLSNYSTIPEDVDRLIISSFLTINKITLNKNRLLKSYLINFSDKDEYNSLLDFTEVIFSETKEFDFEHLIELFEFVISPADRIINGAIYTPKRIRNYIVKEAFEKIKDFDKPIKVADIAMGCGGFLYDAAIEYKNKTGKSYSEIFENHIFGVDIQGYSVTRTKLLLSLLALISGEDEEEFHFNLYKGDSLDFKWESKICNFQGFTIILGNPPYVSVRNLDRETKEKLKNREVCSVGNTDLYIPFFQIAIENLEIDGVLGFITMNSFFKSLNGRVLRNYFHRKELAFSIIDFGSEQIFRYKSTYTCICFIQNRNQKHILYTDTISEELIKNHSFERINYKSLNPLRGWNLKDNEKISKIESTGIPFGNLYKTRHGIATLRNDIYIFKPIDEDEKYFYLKNGSVFKIEKGICKDIINSNKLSRKNNLKELKEKVIFPYEHKEKTKLLKEEIVKSKFPEAYRYLQNKKKILAQRDKGKRDYENWFAFGRTQSLDKVKNKMFFPKYSDITPNFIINTDEDLFYYNGLAVVGGTKKEMNILKKIMESNIFWHYIKMTSKPYASDYYSLNGNYIKNFGVCELTENEESFLINETDQNVLNDFFETKYKIRIT